MTPKKNARTEVYSTTVSSRGQVVLPSGVRRKLGLRKGTRLHIVLSEESDKSILLRPVNHDVVEELRGILRGKDEVLEYLEEERLKDRERGR
jgi:AbrB family looped-hinge helix DNA binding protein